MMDMLTVGDKNQAAIIGIDLVILENFREKFIAKDPKKRKGMMWKSLGSRPLHKVVQRMQ